ncbi:MAG: lipoyl(octanoyl) transferase LipB [Oligoflexales bacterium]
MQREHLRAIRLGKVPYQKAVAFQQLFLQQNEAVNRRVDVLCMEHDPVVTLGKHADRTDLLLADEEYDLQNIGVVQSDRGGLITAHMPGQLVVWPIVKMDPRESVKDWVTLLEQVVIDTAALWGIQAHRDDVNPGVWVGHEKLCAIGLRIQSRYSTHGLALNINNSLNVFSTIVPCGLRNRGVTTMERLTGTSIEVTEVCVELLQVLGEKMSISSSETKNLSEIGLSAVEKLDIL